jgi:hypothetical protein
MNEEILEKIHNRLWWILFWLFWIWFAITFGGGNYGVSIK